MVRRTKTRPSELRSLNRATMDYVYGVPSKAVPTVPASTARRLFLGAQGLLDDPARQATPAAVRKLVQKLGYVQVDSINVIERAHHLILAARLDGYEPRMLHRLLEKSHTLFEHWTHAISGAASASTSWALRNPI